VQVPRNSPGHKHAILALAVSPYFPKGDPGLHWLATGSWDGTVQYWSWTGDGPQAVQTFNARSGVRGLAFSDGGGYLVGGCENASLHLWKLKERRLTWTLPHSGAVHAVTVSPNDKWVLAGCKDGKAYLYDIPSGQKVRDVDTRAGEIQTVCFAPDSRTFLTAGADGAIHLWDVADGRPVGTLTGHEGLVWTAVFSADGRRILSGGQDHTVRLWDVPGRTELARFDGHAGPVTSVAFGPKGDIALSGSMDRTASLWRLPK
jgi:WD40 repeat protein